MWLWLTSKISACLSLVVAPWLLPYSISFLPAFSIAFPTYFYSLHRPKTVSLITNGIHSIQRGIPQQYCVSFVCVVFYFFIVLDIEPRAFHMLSSVPGSKCCLWRDIRKTVVSPDHDIDSATLDGFLCFLAMWLIFGHIDEKGTLRDQSKRNKVLLPTEH